MMPSRSDERGRYSKMKESRDVKLFLNDREVEGKAGQTILQLCQEHGVEVPTLCYSPHLSVYGGCSLCLVEVEGARALLRACSTPISEGMRIRTDSERVRRVRKLGLELMLSDHVGDCRPPCTLTCPARGDVQAYVNLAAEGKFQEAYEVLMRNVVLPASIGRVCPAPCQEKCRRNLVEKEPVSIKHIKRFVGDFALANPGSFNLRPAPYNGKRVAVVGGGPAGISAAYFLRLKGYSVTIFEKEEKLGGMMRYGIPDYRLPQRVLDAEISRVLSLGVDVRLKTALGRDVSLEEIRRDYDAVLLAMGCWRSSPMGVEGENLDGVLKGIEFLYRVNRGERHTLGKRVAVIGGGNTAMDAARCARRLGAQEVYVLYRRTREEMPAEEEEVREAMEEGVKFVFLVAPVRIEGNGKVERVVLQRMELGEPDSSGRRRPIPVPGSEFPMEVDCVIAAIGQTIDPTGLPPELTDGRRMKVKSDYSTPLEGVFVAGDQFSGPDIAIAAIGTGHWAAESIDHYLTKGFPKAPFEYDVRRFDLTEEDFAHVPKAPRQRPHVEPASTRLEKPFEEYNAGLTEEQVLSDGRRCMECGCQDLFECKLRRYAIEYEVDPARFAGEHIPRYEDANRYYTRNMDKCILCGSCVRACDEWAQAHAIDQIRRGFETVVDTPFRIPIERSDCVFCGQCVMFCPTGALVEKKAPRKPHSSLTIHHRSACNQCSLGCEIVFHLDSSTKRVFRATTDHDNKRSFNRGRSCWRGIYNWEHLYSHRRTKGAYLGRGTARRAISDAEGREILRREALHFLENFGEGAVVLGVSGRLAMEEIAALKRWAEELGVKRTVLLEGGPVFTLEALRASGIRRTTSLDRILSSRRALLLGGRVSKSHPVLWMHLKERVRREEMSLAIVGLCEDEDVLHYSDLQLSPEQLMDRDLLGGLVREGASVIASEDLLAPHETEELFKALAGMCDLQERVYLCGGSPNFWKALEMGFSVAHELEDAPMVVLAMESNLNEDPPRGAKELASKASFLAVLDCLDSEIAWSADLILPLAPLAERGGTLYNDLGEVIEVDPLPFHTSRSIERYLGS